MFCTHYTIAIIIIGTMLFGAIIGSLGTFAVLRKQSLVGDVMAHAALPGIALAFLLTGSKDQNILLFGGACSSCLGALSIWFLQKNTFLKHDTILGSILSFFFGIGVVILTYIQQQATSGHALITKFLFGSAATMLLEDTYIIATTGILLCIGIAITWKECVVYIFDKKLTQSLGYKIMYIECILNSSMVFALIIGLQTVGIVLMSSLLIAPAIAARQWTNSLLTMIFLSACFGAIASCIGALISYSTAHIPTGPAIVVTLSIFVTISLMFGTKKRGGA
jgi:manganese/zinc/iron transport system permease protein